VRYPSTYCQRSDGFRKELNPSYIALITAELVARKIALADDKSVSGQAPVVAASQAQTLTAQYARRSEPGRYFTQKPERGSRTTWPREPTWFVQWIGNQRSSGRIVEQFH
jgi:hypothetical protein